MIRFREKIQQDHLAKRVLILNMLESTNQVYPTGRAFSLQLSKMYGASFTTGVSKKGNQHLLTLSMSVVNPHYVNENTVLDALQFIKTALFQPDITSEAFNPDVFKREQINLIHYLEAMNDDRSYFASKQLSKLFFTDKNQALPSIATVDLLKKETAASVYHYYQEMLTNNAIDCFVLGDIDEAQIKAAFDTYPLADRKSNPDVFYQQEIREKPIEVIEKKEVAQSLLQLGFHLPVTYGDKNYLSLQVMNGLLGGFSHSKLFANVREKESLAYSISSTFDSFSNFFKISAGIDAQNLERTKALIFEQLNAIKNGDFSDQELEQTKTMLRNSYYIGQDSPSNTIELEFVKALIPSRQMELEDFITALQHVSKKSIQEVAQSLTYQTLYFMQGQSLVLNQD